ncbi:MAG TPA: TonB-dependent receptor [Sphingobacterium sp.]|nr:TonB-dependent receptor [Sphingobacterium sp.]
MRNIFLLLAVTLWGTVTTKGQNILTGKVLSEQEGKAIPATIVIPKLDKKAGASEAGDYRIENIPNGSYTVVYSMMGYRSLSKKINFQKGETVQEDVVLQETAVEMEEVIVSTVFHMLQSENVMKVERASLSELNAKGAVTLADGLKNIMGVNTVTTGTSIGKPVIRGLSSNRVLTYAQGVRLENQQFGDEHGLGVHEAGIESVEVIKGPASLLYGSDALGGVLYLNPEKFAPSGETHGDISSKYFFNSLGSSTDIGVQHSGEKLKFLLRGAYSTHSDYLSGAGYRVTNSRFNEKDLKTGIQYSLNNFKSALRYNYNRSNLGIPEEIGEQNRSRKLLLPFQEVDNHILSWDNTLHLTHSKITAKIGYTANDRREFEEEHDHDHDHEDDHGHGHEHAYGKTPPSLRMKLNTLNYDVKYHLPTFGKLETIAGVQGMHQDNKNLGEEVLIPDAVINDIGLFATGHYHLEKVDVQAGLRLDTRQVDVKETWNEHDQKFIEAANKNFTSFNAAFGVKWDVWKNIVSRVNVATGYRAPNLAEMTSDGFHHGTFRYEVGSLDLAYEQNMQVDVALEYRRSNLDLFINGFYNKINDYIYLDPTGEFIDENPVYHFKQNNADLYGGEVGFHIHPAHWDWFHLDNTYEMVIGQRSDGEYLPFIPAHNLSHTMQIQFKDHSFWKKTAAFIKLQTNFEQNKVSEFETPTKGYSLLSAGVESGFYIKKYMFKVGVNGTNLTDKRYISHLSRFKPYDIFDMGRSINLRLQINI